MRSCLLCLFLLASALGRPHFENHHNHNSSAHFDTHHNSSSPFFGSHRYPLLVHTSTGKVRGFLRTVGDKEIRVFYGIPYARPPIGDLRFRRPQPVEKWPHVFHADELPNSCYQASIFCCCCFSVCVCLWVPFLPQPPLSSGFSVFRARRRAASHSGGAAGTRRSDLKARRATCFLVLSLSELLRLLSSRWYSDWLRLVTDLSALHSALDSYTKYALTS